eukprot:Platyproteum_vivax@DN12902_c0_g1_i1.p1
MFSLFYGLWEWLFSKKEIRVIMLGLDNAGKSTTLEQMKRLFTGKGLNASQIPPTIGLNIGSITINGSSVIFWDLGGQQALRSIWERYYQECHGLMYVIDSCDVERFSEAKETLNNVLNNGALTEGIPLLLMANKQDVHTALTVDQVSQLMGVEELQGRAVHIHPCSALKGIGVEEAAKWLVAEAKTIRPKLTT